MDVDIQCGPAYAIAYLILHAHESVLVERGAMVAISGNVAVSTGISGSVTSALWRKVAGQESFFMGKYTAVAHGSWVAVASPRPGDIQHLQVTSDTPVLVEAGAMLAASETLSVETKFSGLRNIMIREGMFLLRVSGQGDFLLGAFGGLQKFDLGPSDTLVVDTGHLVAFHQSCAMRVGPLAGLMTAATTGEGLVAQFTGPGSVWVQTRAEGAFRSWLLPDESPA